MTDELKPCPWCGTAQAVHMFGSDDDAYVSRWAECFECGARGPNSIHEGETTPEQESALEAEAQAAWNRRSAASLGEQHDR